MVRERGLIAVLGREKGTSGGEYGIKQEKKGQRL